MLMHSTKYTSIIPTGTISGEHCGIGTYFLTQHWSLSGTAISPILKIGISGTNHFSRISSFIFITIFSNVREDFFG